MKNYVKFVIHVDTVNWGTEKAFPLEIDGGRWSSRGGNDHLWIARSLCEAVSEPNEFGWMEVLIPEWVFTQKRIDPQSIMDVHYRGILRK